MSLTYGEGIALGIAINNADIEARGAANRAEYSARAAAEREDEALTRLAKMTQNRNEWRDGYRKMAEDKVRASRIASVGLIFMNSFKQVIDTLPQEQADKLLSEIRSLTQSRIDHLDKIELAEANAKGERHISIQSELQGLTQYKTLGFDK